MPVSTVLLKKKKKNAAGQEIRYCTVELLPLQSGQYSTVEKKRMHREKSFHFRSLRGMLTLMIVQISEL